DMSNWKIETEDLTELSIVRIREGDPVTITFDALPGFELPGKVAQIKPMGENRQGDVVYTVVVIPDRWDERLRWNMTATVRIAND
ncbi:MAG: efflux RND transporter periplasmic adaptor subunit, partial [Chloroflexaceae bacterium]